MRAEVLRFERQRDSFFVEDWGTGNYDVVNQQFNISYQVILERDGDCDCTFASSYAMACRHVLAVRAHLTPESATWFIIILVGAESPLKTLKSSQYSSSSLSVH